MELIDYIDNYIWLVDEAITVYGSYKVINYGMQNLSYIQDLQDKIQRGHVINIERELIKDFPDTAILKRRLDFLEMKLDGHLIEFKEGEGNDFLGDSFEREKFFIEKLGEKDGVEYALRLHFILSWLNDDRICLLNMIDRLRHMDKKNDKSNNILLPVELDTDEAKKILQRGVDANFLDNNFQPIRGNMTKYQIKRFAELASLELKINEKWKVFGSLWNIKNLGQIKDYEANLNSLKIIESLFPKEIVSKAIKGK